MNHFHVREEVEVSGYPDFRQLSWSCRQQSHRDGIVRAYLIFPIISQLESRDKYPGIS